MSETLKLLPCRMCHTINEGLRRRSCRSKTDSFLTNGLNHQRYLKAKVLLRRYAHNSHRSILFTYKKIFDVEETSNGQNNHVHTRLLKKLIRRKMQRTHHPASITVWWGINYEDGTEIHF